MVFDPLHYKNNLEKLFGSVRPLPVAKLTWCIHDDTNKVENVMEDQVEDVTEDQVGNAVMDPDNGDSDKEFRNVVSENGNILDQTEMLPPEAHDMMSENELNRESQSEIEELPLKRMFCWGKVLNPGLLPQIVGEMEHPKVKSTWDKLVTDKRTYLF